MSCCVYRESGSSAMLHRHFSTVAQNRQTKTLAQDKSFRVVIAFDGHGRYSHTLGKGIQLVAIQQLTTRCH